MADDKQDLDAGKQDDLLAPGEGEVTYTPAEDRAMQDGWRPEGEWDGDPEDWVDAKNFNFRGELMGRISQQGRKLQSLESDNATLSKMVQKGNQMTTKMVEASYKKAVADMRAERREALREGDADRVDEIDEGLDELKDAHKDLKEKADDTSKPIENQQMPDITQMSPQQRAWFDMVQTTPALNQDPVVFNKALQYADTVLTANPNMPVGEFIGKINGHLSGKRASAPGPDDGGSGRQRVSKSKGKYGKNDLSEMELDMAKTFIEDGVVKSYEEYANLLGKDGALEMQGR